MPGTGISGVLEVFLRRDPAEGNFLTFRTDTLPSPNIKVGIFYECRHLVKSFPTMYFV